MTKLLKKTAATVLLLVICASTVFAAFPTAKTGSPTVAAASISVPVQKSTAAAGSSKRELKAITSAKSGAFGGGKSKTVAALLAFFLGSFGVHSFYMGQTVKGFVQLGCTIAGIALFVAGLSSFVSGEALPATAIIGYLIIIGVSIWAFVDFIRILTGGLEPEEGFDH